jgi:dihydroflavonol-4-reductase
VTWVLVTGGCGFIGGHVVAALVARGEQVRVLDLAPPQSLRAGIDFIQGSITEPAIVQRAMRGVRQLYHLAAIPHLWVPQKADFERVNAVGTELVLRVAEECGVERVLHCSTESILLRPNRHDPLGGESTLPPLTDMAGPYTRSKHRAETAAWEAARAGRNVVIVNPTIPIGSEDANRTPPAAMLELFLHGRTPFFLDCILNLADVRDIAAGIILAADRGRPGQRYVLSGENVSLGDLLQRLEALTGKRMPRWRLPASVALASAALTEWIADHVTHRPPPATREGVRIALRSAPFDNRKARDELGYEARPIDEALRKAVQWLSDAERRSRPGSNS